MSEISFEVRGVPQPKGSTKAFFRKGMKFPVITSDNPKMRPWANTVKLVAQQYAPKGGPWDGPVILHAHFDMPKPKSLKKGVVFHTKRPDLDKLLRALKDSLIGVIYTDDSQVCEAFVVKRYGSAPGVCVRVIQKQ